MDIFSFLISEHFLLQSDREMLKRRYLMKRNLMLMNKYSKMLTAHANFTINLIKEEMKSYLVFNLLI